ncbi:MAG: hypothetical protein ACYC1C_02155 [Chloroflexota bacterium]
MSLVTTAFSDVRRRATELSCVPPDGIAILPRNFESAKSREELLNESSSPTVRVLWRQVGVAETRIDGGGARFGEISEKSFTEWVGPTIFIAAAAVTQDPSLVSLALNVMADYLVDFFKGVPLTKRRAKLDVVVEQSASKKCVKIHYEGEPEAIRDLPDVIKEVAADGWGSR